MQLLIIKVIMSSMTAFPASTFTSICKSRNSVLPDSGASLDGKSLQRKRKRKRVRRSRKKKVTSDPASVSLNIYHVNMNGFRSKKDSLKQILCEHDVDILLLTETKVHTGSSIKLEGYQLFPAVRSKRQGGGIVVAIKYGLCSSIMVDKGDEAEFITVRFRFDDQHIRLVLVYGPQENDSVNKIQDFYDSISVQVERANLAGDSVFLVGDFNAKSGAEIIRGEIHQISDNGACLNGIIEKYNLAVLNALGICSGTFTWVKNKIPVEKSVLDYVITSQDLVSSVNSLKIDEAKEFTP